MNGVKGDCQDDDRSADNRLPVGGNPSNTITFSMTPMMAAPISAPNGLPTPPVVATPPMTGAAIEAITQTFPIEGCADPNRATISIPARDAKSPAIMKQMTRTLFTFIPSIWGASRLFNLVATQGRAIASFCAVSGRRLLLIEPRVHDLRDDHELVF